MSKRATAEKILEAAEACLVAGDGSFEMREVTTRASVSEGLAYHHFGNKAGLMSAIVRRFFERYDGVINRPVDRQEPWLKRERERLEDAVDFLFDDPLARIILGGMSRPPEAAAAELACRQTVAERSVRNVQSAQEQGVVPAEIDATLAGPATIGALHYAVLHALAQEPPPARGQVKKEMWRIVLGIVGATEKA